MVASSPIRPPPKPSAVDEGTRPATTKKIESQAELDAFVDDLLEQMVRS